MDNPAWENRASWAVENTSGNPPAAEPSNEDGTGIANDSSNEHSSAWAPPDTTAMTLSPTPKR